MATAKAPLSIDSAWTIPVTFMIRDPIFPHPRAMPFRFHSPFTVAAIAQAHPARLPLGQCVNSSLSQHPETVDPRKYPFWEHRRRHCWILARAGLAPPKSG